MSKDTGGAAFPHVAELISQDPKHGGIITKQITSGGMTLRDYFAAKENPPEIPMYLAEALVGYKAPYCFSLTPTEELIEYVEWIGAWQARWKFIMADAMIAERNKP